MLFFPEGAPCGVFGGWLKPVEMPAQPLNPQDVKVVLTDADTARLTREAEMLTDDLKVDFPGRVRARLKWARSYYAAAVRDTAELVTRIFAEEPSLTPAEIKDYGLWTEFTSAQQTEVLAIRAKRVAGEKLARMEPKLLNQKKVIFNAFDTGFRKNEEVKRQIREIKAGKGIGDTINDMEELSALAGKHERYLRQCTKGEWAIIEEWRALLPELKADLALADLGKKQPNSAVQLRNNAYSMMTQIERRIRAAAEYLYDGQPKLGDYAPYVPRIGAPAEEDEEEPEA